MRVVGVTLVHHAERLDFPVEAAVTSILPLCHKVVVNVGPGDDATADALVALDPRRLHVIRGTWDRRRGWAMLTDETNRALQEARGDWAVYIQADEVLHESAVPLLRDAMQAARNDQRVEGLLVDYLHFYGNFDTVATNRTWYRREVRVVRLGIGITSYRDAQGFRVGPFMRRVRAKRTGARLFHYGWARPLSALHTKRAVDQETFYAGREVRAPATARLPWQVGLRPFRGEHPRTVQPWILARRDLVSREFAGPRWSCRMMQLASALAFERLTGWRAFEYRNYTEL